MHNFILPILALFLILGGCGESQEDIAKEKALVKSIVSDISKAHGKVFTEARNMFSKKSMNQLMNFSMHAYPNREVHIDIRTERRPDIKASAERLTDIIAPLIKDKKEWTVSVLFAYPHGRGTLRDTRREGIAIKVKKGKRL